MNSLSEKIPPDDCIIKPEAQDTAAKARNTGAAGPIPELPLAPGSPLLPDARSLFAGARLRKAEHKFAEPNSTSYFVMSTVQAG